ncbi:MAG: M15 family metallopeptidase [Alphaproteobacteria bacterium]
MRSISAEDLVCMDDLAESCSYRVDLAYARSDNSLFGERIYKSDAKLWLHKDLAQLVCLAAQDCHKRHGLRFVLYDGLRTVDAQEAMMQTRRVKDNPHWIEEPRLLSTPGKGGHPRAMAIDIGLEDENGASLDMGCVFDYMADSPHPHHNRAHRAYPHTYAIKRNRAILDGCMMASAVAFNIDLHPIAAEWWDFRFPSSFYNQYAPLREADLPPVSRLLS